MVVGPDFWSCDLSDAVSTLLLALVVRLLQCQALGNAGYQRRKCRGYGLTSFDYRGVVVAVICAVFEQ